MAGVYGEFLAFFSELFEDFEVYRQQPDVVSGYTLGHSRSVRGIRQTNGLAVEGGKPKTLAVLNIAVSYMLWTYEPFSVSDEFVKIDGRIFRPIAESAFIREGGFYETKFESLSGNDGTKTDVIEVTQGVYC